MSQLPPYTNPKDNLWLTAGSPQYAERSFHLNVDRERLRFLIYAYFFLLFAEGILRKWILPEYSDYLLLARDPVMIVMYAIALRSKLFPWNAYTLSFTALGILCGVTSLLNDSLPLSVTAYGLRTTFAHIPIIFLMPKILDSRDLYRIGFFALIIAIPTALLMVFQYLSPRDAWINTTPGGQGFQIASFGAGKIRPPGPFSFITGISEYFAFVAALLLIAVVYPGVYQRGLVWGAFSCLMLGSLVSISRLTITAIAIVIFAFVIFVLIRPNYTGKLLVAGTVSLITLLFLSQLDAVREALDTFSQRVDMAAQAEGGWTGFMRRISLVFSEPFIHLENMPLEGLGLGMGTNVGSVILTQQKLFLASEGEWARIVWESGPILGSFVLIWRVVLFLHLMWASLRLALFGYASPLLLFASASTLLLIGQWGRPTTLGFAVFLTGYCLCSIYEAQKDFIEREGKVVPMNPLPKMTQPVHV